MEKSGASDVVETAGLEMVDAAAELSAVETSPTDGRSGAAGVGEE